MDYFLFDFSGVQFHYTMSQRKILVGQVDDLYRGTEERYADFKLDWKR